MKRTPQRVIDLLKAEIPSKISRNKFCLQTGINQNSIDKYMAGIAEPTIASLEKLASYFKVRPVWLMGGVAGSLEQERSLVAAIPNMSDFPVGTQDQAVDIANQLGAILCILDRDDNLYAAVRALMRDEEYTRNFFIHFFSASPGEEDFPIGRQYVSNFYK